MNPSDNDGPGLQLPPPVAEPATPAPTAMAPIADKPAPPTPVPAPAGPPSPTGMASTIPLPSTTIMPTVAPTQGAPAASAATTTNLAAASDSDLIEKEWMDKAKQIVDETRDDPYRQSEELTIMKVDYMKKRYNKTIKLNK